MTESVSFTSRPVASAGLASARNFSLRSTPLLCRPRPLKTQDAPVSVPASSRWEAPLSSIETLSRLGREHGLVGQPPTTPSRRTRSAGRSHLFPGCGGVRFRPFMIAEHALKSLPAGIFQRPAGQGLRRPGFMNSRTLVGGDDRVADALQRRPASESARAVPRFGARLRSMPIATRSRPRESARGLRRATPSAKTSPPRRRAGPEEERIPRKTDEALSRRPCLVRHAQVVAARRCRVGHGSYRHAL